ncbi:glycosyltransferase [Amnibacterium sp. CER49]|uniref:glycosyltransferase family 2 protein n=1 Tax=Amnibacterium sp. CER49 TaxID=3039161 RepID=UPI00244928B4|nr:glycosyltransferase [Amnibacterium sp. CER49]MDH2442504.1 glycosyltransferase [Amnibacterium sp. CER49]
MTTGARTRPQRWGSTISVIIPTLDEAAWLPRLLADLAQQTRAPDEVIVADGGSADATEAIAEAAGARTLRSARRGAALQRNAGAVAAGGDVLVFVDADVRLPPRTLERLLASMERRRLDVACPWFRPDPGDPLLHVFFTLLDVVFVLTAPVVPSGGGGLIAVRRDLFAAVGGFDPAYRFEDMRFLQAAGWLGRYRVVLTPVHFSDRRFRRDGRLRTIGTYLLLGVLFAFGLHRTANRVGYRSGPYEAEAAGFAEAGEGRR